MGSSTPSMSVSIRLQTSRPFPEAFSLGFDSYRVKPIPNSDGKEAVLEFKDEWTENQRAKVIAVLPMTTPKRAISRLEKIGIQTITFTKKKDRIDFHDLRQNLDLQMG